MSHKHYSQGCRQLPSMSAGPAALVPRTHFTWPVTNWHLNTRCFWVAMHSFEKKTSIPSVHNFNTVFHSNSASFAVWLTPAMKWKISQSVWQHPKAWPVRAGWVTQAQEWGKFASQMQQFLQSSNHKCGSSWARPWFHFCTFQIT